MRRHIVPRLAGARLGWHGFEAPLRPRRYRELSPGSRSAFSRAISAVRDSRSQAAAHVGTTWRAEGEFRVDGGAWACTRFAMLFDRALEARWPTASVDVYLFAPAGATRVLYVLSGLPAEFASLADPGRIVAALAEGARRDAGVHLVDRGQPSVTAEPVTQRAGGAPGMTPSQPRPTRGPAET